MLGQNIDLTFVSIVASQVSQINYSPASFN
jgi:hypothetical protein